MDIGYAQAYAIDKPLRLINMALNVRRIFELLGLPVMIANEGLAPEGEQRLSTVVVGAVWPAGYEPARLASPST